MDKDELGRTVSKVHADKQRDDEARVKRERLKETKMREDADEARELVRGTKAAVAKVQALMEHAGKAKKDVTLFHKDGKEITTEKQESALMPLGELPTDDVVKRFGFAKVSIVQSAELQQRRKVVKHRWIRPDIAEIVEVPSEWKVDAVVLTFLSGDEDMDSLLKVKESAFGHRSFTRATSLSSFLDVDESGNDQELASLSGSVNNFTRAVELDVVTLNDELDFVMSVVGLGMEPTQRATHLSVVEV